MSSDVVIVGIGCVIPHGVGNEALDRVLSGACEATFLARGSDYVVGRVRDECLTNFPHRSRAVSMALRSAQGALADAGLRYTKPVLRGPSGALAPERVACLFSLSKGDLPLFEQVTSASKEAGAQQCCLLDGDPAAAARAVAARFGMKRCVSAPVTACASGNHVLAQAARLIRDGRADAVLCGASEASLHPLVLASYERLGLLAPAPEDPRKTCRPFSRERSGFYVGEGAAAFVVTSAAVARRAGLRPRAVLRGWAEGAFAGDLVAVPSDGVVLGDVMALAIERSGIRSGELDVVGAHGTATQDGDLNETRAIRRVLGGRADGVPVVATKPLHGHLLGAASAVETAVLVRAMESGVLPPTANLQQRDPECDLDYVSDGPRRGRFAAAMKIAAGFGGQVSAIVLGRF